MQDFEQQRIYCAEQIFVPDELPLIMKNYSKAVIKNQPEDLLEFSLNYFKTEYEKDEKNTAKISNEFEKPNERMIKNEFKI